MITCDLDNGLLRRQWMGGGSNVFQGLVHGQTGDSSRRPHSGIHKLRLAARPVGLSDAGVEGRGGACYYALLASLVQPWLMTLLVSERR